MAPNYTQALKAARAFVRAVQESGIRVQAAYLFGSYAKGYAHPESDIDVALISPDLTGWVDDLDKIRYALRTRDPRIEPVRIRPENFVDENPLAWEIKTTGISLLSKDKNAKRRTTRKYPPRRRMKPAAR